MKKMKWAVLFAALVTVLGFSSCLDSSEEGQNFDLYEYVTVDNFMGSPTLIGDNSGYTYIPTTKDILAALELKDGGYYKRALVAIKLAEPYNADKKSFNISAIQVYNYLVYKECNVNPDTLDAKGYGDYNFNSLGTGNDRPWVRNGFANVSFDLLIPDANPSLNDFHLYFTGGSNDTLYAKLRYTKDNTKNAYSSMKELISFDLPTYDPAYGKLAPRDSFYLTITAKTANGEIKTTSGKFSRGDLR